MRVYRIDIQAADQRIPAMTRLVRARSQSQAVHHIARIMMAVRVASQADLLELLPQGYDVQQAGAGSTDS